MDKFDRIFQLHTILSSRRTPIPLEGLMAKLECSKSTVLRTINSLKEHLNAPIVFDVNAGGYKYDKGVGEIYELPSVWFTENELRALEIMQRLLKEAKGGLLDDHLAPLADKLNALLRNNRLNLGDLTSRKPPPDMPSNAVPIGSVRTLLDELAKLERPRDVIWFFRGHSNFTYEVVPTIYRNSGWIENEDVLFKELILRCPGDFDGQESTFQTLVKMQHYALPTRLLDITANPLIALFFACSPGRRPSEHGEVLLFRIPKTDVKYFDSDTVSVISNVSRRPASFSIKPGEDTVAKFKPSPEAHYLLHEIKKEKPYFEPEIDPHHLQSVVCVKPKLDNARIIRQDGAFLLFGVKGTKRLPAEVPSQYLKAARRILIVPSEKRKLLEQLESLGITKATIYPEIERVAEHIKGIYLSRSELVAAQAS